MKKLILLSFLSMQFLSCSVMDYTNRSTNIPKDNLYVMPTIVDVNVKTDKKITGVSDKVKGVDNALSQAYYNALIANGADIIVDPIYKVKTKSKFFIWGGKSKATVTGYFGEYQNSRKLTESLNEFAKMDYEDVQKAYMLLSGFRFPNQNLNSIIVDPRHAMNK